MIRPDRRASAVKRNDSGTAHFNDAERLNVLDESVDLLRISGNLYAYRLFAEIDDLGPEYIRRLSRSAAEAGRDAIRRLHAAGIPAVFERDGKIIESYPDGHEEVLPETKYKKD